MSEATEFTGSFPKSARLLKRQDFRFDGFKIYRGALFNFVFSPGIRPRLGISISKRILRKSVWRNRIRRLVRESFRSKIARLKGYSIHVVGQPALSRSWKQLARQVVDGEFEELINRVPNQQRN